MGSNLLPDWSLHAWHNTISLICPWPVVAAIVQIRKSGTFFHNPHLHRGSGWAPRSGMHSNITGWPICSQLSLVQMLLLFLLFLLSLLFLILLFPFTLHFVIFGTSLIFYLYLSCHCLLLIIFSPYLFLVRLFRVLIFLISPLADVGVNYIFMGSFASNIRSSLARYNYIIVDNQPSFIIVSIPLVAFILPINNSTLSCHKIGCLGGWCLCFCHRGRPRLIVYDLLAFPQPKATLIMLFLSLLFGYVFICCDHLLAVMASFRTSYHIFVGLGRRRWPCSGYDTTFSDTLIHNYIILLPLFALYKYLSSVWVISMVAVLAWYYWDCGWMLSIIVGLIG